MVARRDLERCEQEIQRIHDDAEQSGKMPAWLVALGTNDWEVERSLIEREGESPCS